MNEPANEPAIDVFCKHCGQTFSTFLKEMAEKNYKAMCPCCGERTEYTPPATKN